MTNTPQEYALQAWNDIEQECSEKVTTLKTNFVNLGARMRYEREKKHISLRRMAKMLGISASYLSDMELGRRKFSETIGTAYLLNLYFVKEK